MKSVKSDEKYDFYKNKDQYFRLKEELTKLIVSESDNLDSKISELDIKIAATFNSLISMKSVTTHDVLTKATFILNDVMKDAELTEYHQDALIKLLKEFQIFIKVK